MVHAAQIILSEMTKESRFGEHQTKRILILLRYLIAAQQEIITLRCMACDATIQSYRFASVQELHEFLWHGKDTEWTFDKRKDEEADIVLLQ